MVKADIKRNYYADLEVSNDASVEDIKKAYRKLALKYHPDRNPGKEAEIVPKFQAIQAAHEILHDPTSKARYDADRRKAGLGGGAFTKPNVPPRSAGTNPMYQATSAYPPPPRRTPNPTASWRSTTQGSSGADRFANFPKPAPTSKKDTTDRANVFNAWQNMKSQGAGASQQPRETPQRPKPPPPPRRDTRFPTEEDIRAGMNYRQPPPNAGFRSAWAEHNAANATKSGASPNVSRSNTTRSPRKAGFDPTSTGDEGQAGSTANYSSSRRKSADTPYYPPPPPRTTSQNADTDPPFTEGARTKTPYSSHIGQQTFSSGDDVRQAANNPQVHTTSEAGPQFRRSTRKTGTGTARKPFVVYSSSDDSETEDDSASTTPETAQANVQPSETPFSRSFTRPKKTPNPPSRQFKNGVPFKAPGEMSGSNNAAPDAAHDAAEKDKPSMYANHFSTPSPAQQKKTPAPVYPFGTTYQHKRSPENIPTWAFPSTVRPTKRSHSAAQRAWQEFADQSLAAHRRRFQPAPSEKQQKAHHIEEDLIDLTQSDSSPEFQQPPKKSCFTKEDAAGLFTMPVNADTFRPTMAKSQSEDNINTAFAPSEWAGAFTSNNVFAAAQSTGRKSATPSRKGSRAFRSQSSANNVHEAFQQQNSTETPQGASRASPPPHPVKYSAEEWKATFKDPSWVFDPDALRSSSPGKNDFKSTSRSNSSARKGSRVANKIPVNTPKPVSVTDEGEEAAGQAQPQNFAASVDEMDVDVTPPAGSSDPPPAPAPPAHEPRMYSVDTNQLRQNDAGVAQPASASSSKRQSEGFEVKLDDLGAAVDPQSSEGLEGLGDIGSTLPFQSKASSSAPNKNFTPQNLQLPSLPRAPSTPTKLSRTSWSEYCQSFAAYLEKFDKFNVELLDHFAARQARAAKLVKAGVRALEAIGEGSSSTGFPSYAQGIKEDERVREHWNIGCEKHAEAVKAFEAVRDRVRVLSEGVGLSEV